MEKGKNPTHPQPQVRKKRKKVFPCCCCVKSYIHTYIPLIGADIKQKALLEWVDKKIGDDLVDDKTGEKVKENIKKQIGELDLSFGKPPLNTEMNTQMFLRTFMPENKDMADWLGSMLFGESQKYIADGKGK